MTDGVEPHRLVRSREGRESFARTIGATILERRADLGIGSQADLARRVGVSEATVRRWEAGVTLPDAYDLHLLAEALEMAGDGLVNPVPLTPREVELMRRAVRAIRWSLEDPAPAAGSGPG